MQFLKSFILMSLLFAILVPNCFADQEATQTTLPLGMSSQGTPFVNIKIQGKVFPVIFDMGDSTGAVTLSALALKGIQVKATQQQNCAFTTSGKVCMKEFVVPEVRLGNLALHNVTGSFLENLWGGNKGFIETPASRNGLLGLRALQNFGVLIDYPHAQIILTKNDQMPQGYDMSTWVKIPFEMKGGIYTHGDINGVPVSLVWDSGANVSTLKPNAKLANGVVNCPPNFLKNLNCKALKTTRLSFNGHAVGNTWFKIADEPFPFDGLLASSFFKDHLVFVDFKNKILFVKNAMK